MGKFKIGLKFDEKFLHNLTQESDSGVEKQTAKHHLSLHPIHLNNFNKSVKNILSEGIGKYSKSLDGILLGYGNIKLISNRGVICNDSPYIHHDLLVDFYVFKPAISKEMRGVVNRKSKDHVGVLVYKTFNVSIPKDPNNADWLGNSVKIGYEVLFKITFIDLSSYLPYIKGEIISIISEATAEINDNDGNDKTRKLKNTKIIFNEETEDENEEPVSKKAKLDDVESGTKSVKTKKSKKQ